MCIWNMPLVTDTLNFWECQYCGEKFDTWDECDEHEQECIKDAVLGGEA